MKTWMKMLLVTLLVGIPAIPLGMMIWPPAGGEGGGELPAYVLAGLMGISVAEGLAFGLGVAFLIFGLPLVRGVAGATRTRAVAMFLAIAWMLLSWWPHSGAHRSMGSIEGLLAIEYMFHLTLIIAGATLAGGFLSILRERTVETAAPPIRPVAVTQPSSGTRS
jgi:hypothetical protein